MLPLRPDNTTYGNRLTLVGLGACACAAWLFALRHLRPGARRLAAATPPVAFFVAAPLFFRRVATSPAAAADASSEIVTIVLVEFALTWLASFKALAWALNRGPLAAGGGWSVARFAAALLAPITPTTTQQSGRLGEHAGGAGAMAAAFAGKAVLLVAGLRLLRLDPPLIWRDFLYTFGLYAILSFAMDGPAAAASALLGLRVSPHFDAPWRAASLAEFWARRWDLAAGNTLRELVYDPILEGRLVRGAAPAARATRTGAAAAAAQRRGRRLPASAACFLVSGLMHELQFAYMTGRHSGGHMLAFFAAQVPLLAAERRLGAALRKHGWLPPTPLRAVATLGTLLLLGHWTFWAACRRFGVIDASLTSLTGVVATAQQLVAACLGRWSGAAAA